MFLLFDTETTGLPKNWNAPLTDFDNWPRVVQIAWQLHGLQGNLISHGNVIVRPEGFTIPYNAEKIHGISTQRALQEGLALSEALSQFSAALARCSYVVGHNIDYDLSVLGCEFLRSTGENPFSAYTPLDTKEISTEFCALPGGKGGKFKWPSLSELYLKLFGTKFDEAHDAAYDIDATAKCFFALCQHNLVVLPGLSQDLKAIHYERPDLAASNFAHEKEEAQAQSQEMDASLQSVEDPTPEARAFVHLHTHSQYSVGIMQSTSEVSSMVARAAAAASEEFPAALALTDHGNMMAAFQFVAECQKQKVKAIVGCEVNLCRDMRDKNQQDNGFQIPLLAMNKAGYHNLAMLSSLAHTQGQYYVPRIDRSTLLQYHENIIALSGGLFGEIPYKILNEGEEKAEEALLWWHQHFGDRFYVELIRHGLDEEKHVNRVLLEMCARHNIRYVAGNVSYYTNRGDSRAQDALVCVREGEFLSRPKKYIGKRGRDFRFGLPNDEYYLKSGSEMSSLFADIPEAIWETRRLADRCESYSLKRDVLLPKFEIPAEFMNAEDQLDGGKRGENNYLRALTYAGAAKRYGEVGAELKERLDFELATIANTGYPGYFLIVQDFCNKAREMGVSVGPGRGSAAGSAVAYCTGITNVDPIRYNLLFERFLNPERVSLPDIDVDFDDEGRDKVIEYVRDKYGRDTVAQIITYGTMRGKSAIRDAGRVTEYPLQETDRLAKCMPDNQNLRELLQWDDKTLQQKVSRDDLPQAKKIRYIAAQEGPEAEVLKLASVLEGSVRNTGIHACGVIITPGHITQFVPVATAKDSDIVCTQFDNDVVESAGLLKMDFLGLKTLSLIKHAVKFIKERHRIDLDIDAIPLDDEKTYQLFQRGHTVGIFQYESDGMRKYLKELKPTSFDDLIAMNALYRPGPLEYIPDFIKRKNGLQQIEYDLPEMAEYLHDTYGITVYQEQVMLLSQKLAGFSKGEADVLRKAMGKKQKDVLDKMKGKFLEGASAKGHPVEKLEKIWTDWEAFASYAFNKSHSTCYAWVAYQTAYIKANYPADYMAAVLMNNQSDLEKLSEKMQDCKTMQIPVQGPDVNESGLGFTVNADGAIRFGLAAIKGIGESAVASIIEEQKRGKFTSVFDFMSRIDARAATKRTLEGLAYAGALDAFGLSRSSYFASNAKGETFIDMLIRYSNAMRESKNSMQVSLFGELDGASIQKPNIPAIEPWDTMMQLTKEKEVIGMFISGHPLDDFREEIKAFCSRGGLQLLKDIQQVKGRELRLAGIITSSEQRISKNNKPFGIFTMEDYDSSSSLTMFGDDYLKYRHLLSVGSKVLVVGKVMPRMGREEYDLEYKITRVEPLFDVMEKLGRFLDLRVSVDKITTQMIDSLERSLKNGKGKAHLRMRVVTPTGEFQLASEAFQKLELSTASLEFLASMQDVSYMISEK